MQKLQKSMYDEVVPFHPGECSVRLVYNNIEAYALRNAAVSIYKLTGKQPHIEIWGNFVKLDGDGEVDGSLLHQDITLPGLVVDEYRYASITTRAIGEDGYEHPLVVLTPSVIKRALLYVTWS